MKDYKILFITGHRKSGTSMLNNLFDGHDDFLVYPNDISIFYGYYPNFIGKKFSFMIKKKRLLNVISKSLKNVSNNKNFDKNLFIKSIEKSINKKNIDKIKEIFKLIIKNFVQFSTKKNFKYIVIKETSMGMLLQEINKWFKKIKFIQIIRDPRDNYSSLNSGFEKYYKKNGESKKILLSSMINRASLDFKFIKINKDLLGSKKFYYCKFEDIVTKPKNQLQKICKYLNINFSNKLLYPSVLGSKTKGNNFENKKLFKISKINVNNWKTRISKIEIEILEFYFQDIIKDFDYKKIKKINSKSVRNYYTWLNKNFYFKDSFK